MSLIQELSEHQIRQSLAEAIRRGTPVALTCRSDGQWHNLRTRILRRTGPSLWLDAPTATGPEAPPVAAGMEVGLSFKLKHHKHIANVPVEAVCPLSADGAEGAPAVRVAVPARMQRIQRRAYLRAEVPRNRSVLATFALGGPDGDAADAEPSRPTWDGWVTDISAGGFQVRLAGHGTPELDLGDLVTVSVQLGQEFAPIVAAAQFRQEHVDERNVVHHGFQFVGLNESEQGRRTLRRIGQVVCDFQRLAGRRRAKGVA